MQRFVLTPLVLMFMVLGSSPSLDAVPRAFAAKNAVFRSNAARPDVHGVNPLARSTCTLTWQVIPGPVIKNMRAWMKDITAISPDDVWAVGASYDSNGNHALIEHWDGRSWEMVPNPPALTEASVLTSVSAIASDDVWAGGYNWVSGSLQGMSLHWDGTVWGIIPIPYSVGSLESFAVSSNGVWAIAGDHDILHWDGSAWNLAPGPSSYDFVTRIIVRAGDDVWLTGGYSEYIDPQTKNYLAVWHWDGTVWSLENSYMYHLHSPLGGPSPEPNVKDFAFISADDIWVAINHVWSRSLPKEELWHWDSFSWTKDNAALPDGLPVTKIRAAASDDVWFGTSSYFQSPAVFHWNGSAVIVESLPTSARRVRKTSGLDAVSPNDVWVVGSQWRVGQPETEAPLFLHRLVPCVKIPPTPNLIAPPNDAALVPGIQEFKWSLVHRETYFEIEFYNKVTGWRQSFFTPDPTFEKGDFSRKGQWRWRVRACNKAGCSGWTKWWKFSIRNRV